MDSGDKPSRQESTAAWQALKQAAIDLGEADSEDDAAYDLAVARLREVGRAYFTKCRPPPGE